MTRIIHSFLFFMLIVALILTASGGCERRRSPDEEFWSADPLLDAELKRRGKATVLAEIRDRLDAARKQRYSVEAIPNESRALDEIVQDLRWAAILGDEESLAFLDALSTSNDISQDAGVLYYLNYMSRWAGWRIRTADLALPEKLDRMMNLRRSSDPMERIFGRDRLIDLGAPALKRLIQHARENLFPRVGDTVDGILLVKDVEATIEYNELVGLVSAMIHQTPEDRDIIEALITDPDPKVQNFAKEVLSGFPQ